MENFREIRNHLTWHNEGKFSVELVNGIISKLNFCEPGAGPDVTGKCLTSTNYKFLQNVYNCLGDLFAFIEEENKRLGYTYAQPGEIPAYSEDVVEAGANCPTPTLRPLINYNSDEAAQAEQMREIV
jgi:hypothetical protein